jgi:hypothetical protein
MLTRYHSVTLPFLPTFPRLPHVGRPVIRANTPFLNTTKYRDKHVLWMSSTAGRDDHKALAKFRQFLSAFALLAHSVAYLAWSQGVEGIGIEEETGARVRVPATSVLRLLAELARSDRLGSRSHEPGTNLLNHLGYSLDVGKVLEAVIGPEDDQGWDIVEPDAS